MEDAQCKLQENPLDLNTHRFELMLLQEYLRLAQAEKSFPRQKSWIQQLNLGDKNLKFFFNLVKRHQCHNKILSIHDDNGTCISDSKEIRHIIVSYLRSFQVEHHQTLTLIFAFLGGLCLTNYPRFKSLVQMLQLLMMKFKWSYFLLMTIKLIVLMVSAWVSSRELGALLVRTPSTLSIHSSFQVNFSKK